MDYFFTSFRYDDTILCWFPYVFCLISSVVRRLNAIFHKLFYCSYCILYKPCQPSPRVFRFGFHHVGEKIHKIMVTQWFTIKVFSIYFWCNLVLEKLTKDVWWFPECVSATIFKVFISFQPHSNIFIQTFFSFSSNLPDIIHINTKNASTTKLTFLCI